MNLKMALGIQQKSGCGSRFVTAAMHEALRNKCLVLNAVFENDINPRDVFVCSYLS